MSRHVGRSSVLMHRWRSHETAAALVVVALLLCVRATPAAAGVYKIHSCNVPGKNSPVLSAAPWRGLLDGGNTRLFDDCLAGGGFGLALNPQQPVMARGGSAGVELRRPEAGPKSAIGIVGYRTWITADFTGAIAFIEVGGAFSPPGGTNPDNAPWVSAPFSPTNPVVYVLLYCATGQESCHFANTTPMIVRGIETDLYESVLPAGSLVGGTLLTGQPQRGSRTVSFTATDEESGVAKIEFLLGNAVVGSENLDTDPAECPHVDWAACPPRYTGQLSVDTSSLADGEYVATLRVTDAAGNRRVVKHSELVTLSNPVGSTASGASPAGSSGGSGGGSSNLTARFASTAHSSYTTPFGRVTRIRGRLTDANGQPIPNAELQVTEKLDLGGPARRKSAKTGGDGTYSYLASGRLPSRRIELRYMGPAASPGASRKLRLVVKAASTLRITLRGTRVGYSGRVLAQPLPRGGTKVYVQGRAKGGVWQRFATRRANASGRFAGRYRLRVRRPGIRLQFRIEIPRQRGYPYAAHTGSPVTRTVR